MWHQFLKDYFSFTKRERKGITILILLLFLLVIIPKFFPYFVKEKVNEDASFEREIEQLQADEEKGDKNSTGSYFNDYSIDETRREKKMELFFFDPNTASADDWMKLGVREKTAFTIQKYVAKGGRFYKPEDIKKIWGLREAEVERLLPFVKIKVAEKESLPFAKKEVMNYKPYERKTIQSIDVNLADSTAFITLPGIGSRLSLRIISFREKLGGFYSIDQVGETYFLPDSTFQKIKPYLVLSPQSLKQININEASVEEMKSHPYIRYNIANAIFQYRKQHGIFSSLETLKKIAIIDEEIFNKIAPYLVLE